MIPRIGTIVLAVALLAGCASDTREKVLQVTLDTYAAAMRWSDFNRVLSLVHPDSLPDRARLDFIMQRYQQVRVTGYRVTSTLPGSEPDTVMQEAQVRLSNRHTAVERTIIDRQVWWWDAEQERWWLKSGPPDISRGDGG